MKIKDIRVDNHKEEQAFRILITFEDNSQNSIWLQIGMSVSTLIRSLIHVITSLTYTFNDSDS